MHLLGQQRLSAFGTDRHGIEDVPAFLMLMKQRPAALVHHVDIAPVHDGHHDRVKVEPLLGQDIFVALGRFLIGDPPQDAEADQLFQAFGEEVSGDAERGLKGFEPAGPQEALSQDEKAPAVANDADGAGHGTRLFFKFIPSHGRLRFAADRWI